MSVSLSFDDIEKEIERIQHDYYEENGGKNTFFKKAQKFDCASQVANVVSIELLLEKTCYILENTNIIHIEYGIFKTYANPENYEMITDFIISKLKYVQSNFKDIEVMMNLDGFTVSAAERYKHAIKLFLNKCFRLGYGFAESLSQFTVYNASSSIEQIKHIIFPLIDKVAQSKIVLVSKTDTENYLAMLPKRFGYSATNVTITEA